MSREKKRPKALPIEPELVTDVTYGLAAFNGVVSIASALAATAIAATGVGLIVLGVAAGASVLTVGALRAYRYYKDRKKRIENEQALEKKRLNEGEIELENFRKSEEFVHDKKLSALQRRIADPNDRMSEAATKAELKAVQLSLQEQRLALPSQVQPAPTCVNLRDYFDLSSTELGMSTLTNFFYHLSNAITVGNFSLNVALTVGLSVFAAGTLTAAAGIIFGVTGGGALVGGIGYTVYAVRKQLKLAAKLEEESQLQLQKVNDWLVEKMCDDQLDNNAELMSSMCLSLHSDQSFMQTLMRLNHVEDEASLLSVFKTRAQELGLKPNKIESSLNTLVKQHDSAMKTLQENLLATFLEEVQVHERANAELLMNQLLKFPGNTVADKLNKVFLGPPKVADENDAQRLKTMNNNMTSAAKAMNMSSVLDLENKSTFKSSKLQQAWQSIKGAKLAAGILISVVGLISMALLLNPMTLGIVVGIAVVGGAVAFAGYHIRKRNQEKLHAQHIKRETFVGDLTATMKWTDQQLKQAKALTNAENTVTDCLQTIQSGDYSLKNVEEKLLSVQCSEGVSNHFWLLLIEDSRHVDKSHNHDLGAVCAEEQKIENEDNEVLDQENASSKDMPEEEMNEYSRTKLSKR